MKQKSRLFQIGSLLLCLGLLFTNASKVRMLANVDESFRILHARELLGEKLYARSPISLTEGYLQVNQFVLEETRVSLPKKYQDKSFYIAQAIIKESNRYELDPIFVLAVIQHESRFNPDVIGKVGEIGLMQIRPETGKWISQKYSLKWQGNKTLRDPETNVLVGCQYLSYLREMFGHGRLYLSAYNIGPNKVKFNLARNNWPKEYSSKVMKKYIELNRALATKAGFEKLNSGKMVADIQEVE